MKNPKIVFEDDYILIVNKPSGLVVNRAESVKGKTLQDWLENKWPNWQIIKLSKSNPKWRSGIVHRLDKDTSGLLIIAKNLLSFKNLQSQFKKRQVKKKYLALVHGLLKPRAGNINLPLARDLKDRKKFNVRLGGRKSKTFYQLKNYFNLAYSTSDRLSNKIKISDSNMRFSLLEIQPKTGRTHQIRVHLKYIGFPIVADPIYLGKKRLKDDLKWCPRLFLQAKYLSFFHPQTGQVMEFKIRLPKELLPENLGLIKSNFPI